jgi:hypothetical protein
MQQKMSKVTTTPATPKFDLENPERIDLNQMTNPEKEAILTALSDFLPRFDFLQHLEDCYELTAFAQDYGFHLPINFYSNTKSAIELQQKIISVINRGVPKLRLNTPSV